MPKTSDAKALGEPGLDFSNEDSQVEKAIKELNDLVSFRLGLVNCTKMPMTLIIDTIVPLSPILVWSHLGRKPGRLKSRDGDTIATFQTLDELSRYMASRPWVSFDRYVAQEDVGDLDFCMNYYANEVEYVFLFGCFKDGLIEAEAIYPIYCRLVTDPLIRAARSRGFRGFIRFNLRIDTKSRQAWVIGCNFRKTEEIKARLRAR